MENKAIKVEMDKLFEHLQTLDPSDESYLRAIDGLVKLDSLKSRKWWQSKEVMMAVLVPALASMGGSLVGKAAGIKSGFMNVMGHVIKPMAKA